MDKHSLSIHWYEETKKRLSEDGDTSIIEQIQKTKKRVGGERATGSAAERLSAGVVWLWSAQLAADRSRERGCAREREWGSDRRRDDTGDERGAWECVGVQRKGCAVPASARRGIRSSETASSQLPRCASARQPSQSLQVARRGEGARLALLAAGDILVGLYFILKNTQPHYYLRSVISTNVILFSHLLYLWSF